MSTKIKTSGLWNRNFFLLWQGQLVSDLGDAAFNIALGFWVLAKTGSTGMMGLIMACFAAPVVILGPLSGTFADRLNRKVILVVTDFIRGSMILLLGILILTDRFSLWVIFPIAIISGICDSFFGPAVNALVPDLVAPEKLTQANSARSLSQGLSQLLGNSFGGFLYSILTAPVLFIIDGASFIFSAFTEMFIQNPRTQRTGEKKHVFAEMVEGMKYVNSNVGLKKMLLTCMLLNFFATMGLTLLTPLFSQTESLGVARYGLMMGGMMLGGIISMVLLSILKIKASQRYFVFAGAMLCMDVFMVLIGFSNVFVPMLVMAFFAGAFNIIVNVLFQTVVQLNTPPEYLGKVFGIISTLSGALSPIAMAVCGVVAQFFGVRNTIVGCFIIAAVSTLPMLLSSSLKRYIHSGEAVGEAVEAMEAIPEAE